MKHNKNRVSILPQPNDVTCGPTCLHAIYNYYSDPISLSQVIEEVQYLETGGTLAVLLGLHALKRGYDVTINVLDLDIFDPTWFVQKVDLIGKLELQMHYKQDHKIRQASMAYIEFLHLGGKVISKDISSRFLKESFERYGPILSGLSSTYLYRFPRELLGDNKTCIYDDVRGYPSGHFVVLNGYCSNSKTILIADPYNKNPHANLYYEVRISRLINAILIGELTYDANLLFIQAKKRK